MSIKKLIYSFGNGNAEGNSSMKDLLGGKGANLAEMSKLGLPIPLGFTLTTSNCTDFYKSDKKLSEELLVQVKKYIKNIENELGSYFGDKSNPLLFSVRSGAKLSMPGMMDTILNLGLNDDTVIGLANKSNNERFAYDSYRRFIQMYSDVVLGIKHYHFESLIETKKQNLSITSDTEFSSNDLKELCVSFKDKVKKETGEGFPQNVNIQLNNAIYAVFNSWTNERAITYRKIHNIEESWGTAVNIQSMIFGNMGNDCATGVVFTRNPSTGKRKLYGEYLINAQGEDVVAGIRTPQPIVKDIKSELPSMEEEMPVVYKELEQVCKKLELHYRDMQDIEFTVQNNKLWILQTRNGKRASAAAIKISVDMIKEKIITKEEALTRIDPLSLDSLLHPTLDYKQKIYPIAVGLPASPGASSGKVVFSSQDAEKAFEKKQKVILVRTETSPDDIKGMHISEGILTSKGGMTSHAAVVARGMGKPCISGANTISINYKKKYFVSGKHKVKEGDIITIDGSKGEVMLGEIPTLEANLSEDFKTIMSLANQVKRIKIRVNAETEDDCKTAIKFGCEGIGLCRTEHMFFSEDRINYIRKMILADNEKDRNSAIGKLLPMQQNDFIKIFKIMNGLPVNIRLLDPPLHEFLPSQDKEIEELSNVLQYDILYIKERINGLKEENPMLGHRGCRLGISYPEIYKMQVRAIFNAAIHSKYSINKESLLEIMVPLISTKEEFKIIKKIIIEIAKEIEDYHNIKLNYMIGTMIELPRAALTADEIASDAEFFSFGTNDLTQTTFGLSRDDSSNFLPIYKEKNILPFDPFATIDQKGVGELIKIACTKGRNTKSNLKLGICGEHGGDPKSIEFFNNIGVDYVSCSPYRIPIARLSAAISTINQ